MPEYRQLLNDAAEGITEPWYVGVVLRKMNHARNARIKSLIRSDERAERHRGFVEAVDLLLNMRDEIRKEIADLGKIKNEKIVDDEYDSK